jgi:hypothetical protein
MTVEKRFEISVWRYIVLVSAHWLEDYETNVTADRKLQFNTKEQQPRSHIITSQEYQILNYTDYGYVFPLKEMIRHLYNNLQWQFQRAHYESRPALFAVKKRVKHEKGGRTGHIPQCEAGTTISGLCAYVIHCALSACTQNTLLQGEGIHGH